MAFIPTPRLEMSARQAFDISKDDPSIFLHKPIALAFLAFTLILFLAPVVLTFCKICQAKMNKS